MTETLRHREAFEYYYGLGQSRSLVAVASQFNVSERTVARWSKNFAWQERIEQRDIENAKHLEKKTNEVVVNEKANYRKIIKAAIGDFVRRMASGDVTVNSVSDLERLVKLDLLLMGEATENNTIEISVTVDEN